MAITYQDKDALTSNIELVGEKAGKVLIEKTKISENDRYISTLAYRTHPHACTLAPIRASRYRAKFCDLNEDETYHFTGVLTATNNVVSSHHHMCSHLSGKYVCKIRVTKRPKLNFEKKIHQYLQRCRLVTPSKFCVSSTYTKLGDCRKLGRPRNNGTHYFESKKQSK